MVFQSSFNNLPLPSTRFILNVTGPTVYIEASESNLGRKVDIPYIEPVLKNALTEYGFTFTDAMSEADIMIELKAGAKRGSEMYAMFTSYANLTISVVDLVHGDEVYKNSLQDVKGIQLNYQRAGVKALENAASKVKESILPDLIEHLWK